jgi:hypothetical protein
LEEVSIIKSVPNLIFYFHEFSWIFSQFLAICFELFSFESDFLIQKNADVWGPMVSGTVATRRALVGCCGW